GDPVLLRRARTARAAPDGDRDQSAASDLAARDPRRGPSGRPLPADLRLQPPRAPLRRQLGRPRNLMTYDYDFGGSISPDGRRRPEYDEAIRLTATLEAWGERLATARPVPLSATPLTGMKTGGALALEGGGLIVGPAEVEGLDTAVRLRPTAGTIEGDA